MTPKKKNSSQIRKKVSQKFFLLNLFPSARNLSIYMQQREGLGNLYVSFWELPRYRRDVIQVLKLTNRFSLNMI